MEYLVEISGVTFRYRRKVVLREISLTVERGESVAIVGPSGSGKSTLAAIVSTLLRPEAGTVQLHGQDVLHMRSARLAAFRRTTIGMVFQNSELIPTMTAVENVALPAMLDGRSWDVAREQALTLLDDLQVDQIDTPAGTLSGGEAQRVGIARALVNTPALIVADEPTASLDGRTKEVVAEVLYAASRARGAGMVVVSHAHEVARRADRVLRLETGMLDGELTGVS